MKMEEIVCLNGLQLKENAYYAALAKLYKHNLEHFVIYHHGFPTGVGCILFNPTYEDGFGIELSELGKNAKLAVIRELWEPSKELKLTFNS